MAHPGWAMGFRGERRRPTGRVAKAVGGAIGSAGRAAAVAAAGAALLLGAVACTGSSDQDDAGHAPGSAGAANNTAASAPPGKYRLLPEPCGSVTQQTLDKVAPGAASGTEQDVAAEADASKSPESSAKSAPRHGGKASLTFDTDRRSGCEWSIKAAAWTRYLHVDFERVVSYDNQVSDEHQAEDEYLQTATKAEQSGAATHSVDGVGDDAFATEATSGGSRPHRSVTLVFRKDNVMVTVDYRDWPQGGRPLPGDTVMQSRARLVAGDLDQKLAQE